MKVGIIGLPNVGKSTIFNALTASDIPANNYPFCTIEPNIGIVPVPDARLSQINQFIKTNKILSTVIEFVDIAGLVKGASKGEGLGNKFLSHIRNVDAIVHVVRAFKNNDITHVEGNIDPAVFLDDPVHEVLHGHLVRHVGFNGCRLASFILDHPHRFLRRFQVAVDGHDLGAFAGVQDRRGAAVAHGRGWPRALAGAENEGDFVLETHCLPPHST